MVAAMRQQWRLGLRLGLGLGPLLALGEQQQGP
jgi:hypothetical protein